jgi:coenzyme F420-reducing hydrogenase gamma subunit
VAFFDFTACEGCQLQVLNNEATLLDFLDLVEVVNFREAMTERSDAYEIAFVEGSISRADEIGRLRDIRKRAKMLVAFGTCACFGGVNQLKNRFDDLDWVRRQAYGPQSPDSPPPVDTDVVRPLDHYVSVDLQVPGCPIRKEEFERVVVNLALGKPVTYPAYPLCMECKANANICLFDVGEPCLGPVTRAGCDAWCPGGGTGCWGCRGPADNANVGELVRIMRRRGVPRSVILDRLECFGAFSEYTDALRPRRGKSR